MAGYNVLDVSRYVIDYSNRKEYGISNLKLQKVLYFIQAYFLTNEKNGTPCFRERIEAWDFGPVVPEAYREYRQYGSCNIPTTTSYMDFDVSNIWKHETDVRGVETAILFGIREMAAIIYPAVVMGKMDAEVNEFFYKALCMISYGMSKEDLLPVVQELGEMNQKCRELLGQV